MIKITKTKEPKEWTEKINTPGFKEYSPIPELRDALLNDQGYICAYCMNRIGEDNSKIEHIKSRSKYPELQLEYSNMVICCKGITDNEKHCDTCKGNQDISFDLFSDSFFNTISYKSSDGEILSTNTEYNKEINNILNLNHKTIKRNRFSVLDGVIKSISKKKDWTKKGVNNQLTYWSNKDKDYKYQPYCGIIIWYLEKKLRSFYN